MKAVQDLHRPADDVGHKLRRRLGDGNIQWTSTIRRGERALLSSCRGRFASRSIRGKLATGHCRQARFSGARWLSPPRLGISQGERMGPARRAAARRAVLPCEFVEIVAPEVTQGCRMEKTFRSIPQLAVVQAVRYTRGREYVEGGRDETRWDQGSCVEIASWLKMCCPWSSVRLGSPCRRLDSRRSAVLDRSEELNQHFLFWFVGRLRAGRTIPFLPVDACGWPAWRPRIHLNSSSRRPL